MEKAVRGGQLLIDDEILTPKAAGALFGVTESAMYKRVKNGQAPAHYMGRKLYFLKSELIGFIRNI